MSYTMLAVRTSEEDDGAIFPVIGSGELLFESERLDGPVTHFIASAAVVAQQTPGGPKTVAKVADVKIHCYISAARVVIACPKWDKGGGWVGFGGAGVAVALVADGISKARAAHRRHGKMLLGQVRYPWLVNVGYRPKLGWGSAEQVRLVVAEGTGTGRRRLMLDLTLPKDMNSEAVARAVITKAAAYRLEHTTIDSDEERAGFTALLKPPVLPTPAPKTFALWTMPTSYPVGRGTAYPKPAPEVVQGSAAGAQATPSAMEIEAQ